MAQRESYREWLPRIRGELLKPRTRIIDYSHIAARFEFANAPVLCSIDRTGNQFLNNVKQIIGKDRFFYDPIHTRNF